MTFAPQCICGKSISGVCTGNCDRKNKIVWSDFVTKYQVNEEEQEQLYHYLKFIRFSPHTDELKKIAHRLKEIFNL